MHIDEQLYQFVSTRLVKLRDERKKHYSRLQTAKSQQQSAAHLRNIQNEIDELEWCIGFGERIISDLERKKNCSQSKEPAQKKNNGLAL